MTSLSNEVLDRYGEELRYAQRELRQAVGYIIENEMTTANPDSDGTVMAALDGDLADPDRFFAVKEALVAISRWPASLPVREMYRPDVEALAKAAGCLNQITWQSAPNDRVAGLLGEIYQELGVPSYGELQGRNLADVVMLLAWVDEQGNLSAGSIADLAGDLKDADLHGCAVVNVYAVDGTQLSLVKWATEQGPQTEDFWATVTLTVTLPNGHQAKSTWRADLAV